MLYGFLIIFSEFIKNPNSLTYLGFDKDGRKKPVKSRLYRQRQTMRLQTTE
ncbi:hypothetical protein OKV01_11875 [Clostridioides difficile]|nr:hypothetical protein [Clostridioides difficile]